MSALGETTVRAQATHALADQINAYVALTKPRVISLLLVTTLGAMMVAARGLPPLHIVIATLIGGYLGAGGANAINHFLDRDIDLLMRRTSTRPIPSGAVSPERALIFGIALGIASFVLLATVVNLLAAVLTIGALAYYVFVYTSWLKRSSVQNIVIGGAAGAVPPLVGWAAVTGEVSLLAIYLFAIVFYWTPPHFWALSLLIKDEYRRAHVPMLPVVRGDEETHHEILLYTLFLLALTVVVGALGLLGRFYLGSALALGTIFTIDAIRLVREADRNAALRVYKYSLLYLALLFVAMVIDRQLML
ncbi:MAG: heme o synthase [Chloroflexota bacterium]|nr:heme o synthase [Chloroflexota bacterium]